MNFNVDAQQNIFNQVIDAYINFKPTKFIVYGPSGSGKSYLLRLIKEWNLANLRHGNNIIYTDMSQRSYRPREVAFDAYIPLYDENYNVNCNLNNDVIQLNKIKDNYRKIMRCPSVFFMNTIPAETTNKKKTKLCDVQKVFNQKKNHNIEFKP